MDFIEAEHQRNKLDRALKKHIVAPTIPPCDDGRPCIDGRCPMCGADLAALLVEFLNSSQASTRKWTQAAFVLNTQSVELGCSQRFPLGRARTALQAISNALQTDASAFIGTFGTRGLGVQHGNIILSRGASWPWLLNAFIDPTATGTSCMEHRTW